VTRKTCIESGGKKSTLPRLHLEFLSRDFDVRLALEQVADLLDPGMRMRQRTLAPLDLADEHFELLRADGFRTDQPEILRCRCDSRANRA
jgi:hypothetical protein